MPKSDLLDAIWNIPIADSHEHIMSMAEVKQDPVNLFKVFMNSYARLDLVSAGMPPQAQDLDHDPEAMWPVFEKYQPYVLQTSYYRNIIRALQGLYGLKEDRLTAENWRSLSERVTAAYERDDWYHHVLREQGNVQVSLLDTFWSVDQFTFDPSLFRPVLRTNPLIFGRGFQSAYPKGRVEHTKVEDVAAAFDCPLDTFADYLAMIRTVIKRYKEAGAPAVKIGTAYERTLDFRPVPDDEAAALYAKQPAGLSETENRRLQDFMARYIITVASEEGLPIQIHTGILARNANILPNSNPEHLNSLFIDFPQARFVLLHFSFPYVRQALSLTKMFPHVYIDFVWMPLLSTTAARQALAECLDLVPLNKIMWGGDAYRVEEAYGAACLMREVLADVLTDQIARGMCNEEDALAIAKRILYQNTVDFFQI
ncbi:MAG TPA: amidohydrolase family protein [Firmicutes bacterium]|jgi:predicted TIM-barrel fold metal-dependent hydrolase|nr:amidohydrolase family protein [Bacillota bacterium]